MRLPVLRTLQRVSLSPSVQVESRLTYRSQPECLTPGASGNGQRYPGKLMRAVIARLLGRKP